VFSPAAPAAPARTPAAPATSGRQVLRGVLAVGALGFLAGGLVYAYRLVEGITHRPAAVSASDTAPSAPPLPEAPVAEAPVAEAPVTIEGIPPLLATVLQRLNPSPQLPSPQLPSPQLREMQPIAISQEAQPPSTLEERVRHAVDNGLAYLRKQHKEFPQYRNYIALLGLTLLECGIAADDPSVQQIAERIRARERDLRQTYELTLAILFLDRLGEARDRHVINTFGQRLLAGQLQGGTWSYSCLLNEKRWDPIKWPTTPMPFWNGKLDSKGADQSRRLRYRGDNSNTQFAILGLWVAQRHGVSSRSALLATEQYFRATQFPDGSWSYHPAGQATRDSMTCAGLMSLALRWGVISGQGPNIRPTQPSQVRDGAIDQGLRYLAQSLDKIRVTGASITGVEARDPLYFLWSLERMAVIYDLKKIGTREWYPWAAEMLVETQQADGQWWGAGDPVGTCFALLVLKRSNFAKDLQLAVQETPSSPMTGIAGPTIVQGMDAFMQGTAKPKAPPSMPGTAIRPAAPKPLGPSITQTPNSK
jgi:hypothetical protein